MLPTTSLSGHYLNSISHNYHKYLSDQEPTKLQKVITAVAQRVILALCLIVDLAIWSLLTVTIIPAVLLGKDHLINLIGLIFALIIVPFPCLRPKIIDSRSFIPGIRKRDYIDAEKWAEKFGEHLPESFFISELNTQLSFQNFLKKVSSKVVPKEKGQSKKLKATVMLSYLHKYFILGKDQHLNDHGNIRLLFPNNLKPSYQILKFLIDPPNAKNPKFTIISTYATEGFACHFLIKQFAMMLHEQYFWIQAIGKKWTLFTQDDLNIFLVFLKKGVEFLPKIREAHETCEKIFLDFAFLWPHTLDGIKIANLPSPIKVDHRVKCTELERKKVVALRNQLEASDNPILSWIPNTFVFNPFLDPAGETGHETGVLGLYLSNISSELKRLEISLQQFLKHNVNEALQNTQLPSPLVNMIVDYAY